MNTSEYKTIDELRLAYSKGQREFEDWDFEEDESAEGMNLSGVIFKNCFLFLNFRNTNLTNSIFINCNLKTADFSGANLENGLIRNCSVESTMFNGANTKGFRFEENYCYGATTKPGDFEKIFKNSDVFYEGDN